MMIADMCNDIFNGFDTDGAQGFKICHLDLHAADIFLTLMHPIQTKFLVQIRPFLQTAHRYLLTAH